MAVDLPMQSYALDPPGGFASGWPGALLRLEGVGLLLCGLVGYRWSGQPWLGFLAFFLVPDLSTAGYLFGARVGSAAYNVAHSYVWPLFLLGLTVQFNQASLQGVTLIWLCHIGADRAFGYGFKYAAVPGVTHLGLVGRARMTRDTRSASGRPGLLALQSPASAAGCEKLGFNQ